MFIKRITIALALVLTMFAVDAKADYTPSTKCSSYMQNSHDTVHIGDCCYNFEFCWRCPEPQFGILLEVYIGQIRQIRCDPMDPNPPTTCNHTGSQIFAAIERKVSSIEFLLDNCPELGNVPPCVGQGAGYLTVKIVWPTCWKAKLVSGLPVFDICSDECSVFCVHTYRYCYDPFYNTVYAYLFSETTEGDLLHPMCFNCDWWHITDLGNALTIPLDGSYTPCFMVCGF